MANHAELFHEEITAALDISDDEDTRQMIALLVYADKNNNSVLLDYCRSRLPADQQQALDDIIKRAALRARIAALEKSE